MRHFTLFRFPAAAAVALAVPVSAQPAADYSDPLISKEVQGAPPSEPEAPSRTIIEPAQTRQETGGPIFVGAVAFTGLQTLVPADFADLVASRIGREWQPAELSDFASAIASRVRSRGNPFATASIVSQRVANGVLTIQVEEGRIDDVRLEGTPSAAVRSALEPLIGRAGLRLEEVERRLMIASDIDGVRIDGSRFVRENGRGVLVVRVNHDPVVARLTLSNAGTKPVGPEQARIEVNLNGVLASDDSLSMSYSTTPAEPRELQFGFLRYEKRVSATGTEIALTGTASLTRPGAYLAPLDIKNRSWYVAGSVLQPLLRRRKASFWLETEIGVRDLAQWRDEARVRDDRVVTARATVYGYRDVAGGRARVSSTLSQGLGILGATRSSDPLRSRWDADGTFTTLNLWADWTGALVGDISLRVAAQGQISSQPLLISEETTLGGTVFLRGYDWGERSGDQGLMGMAELRYALDKPLGLARRAQLYTFLDGGSISNRRDGFGGGSLASAGAGARVDLSANTGLSIEVGVPLTGARYDTGDKTPKLNVSLGTMF